MRLAVTPGEPAGIGPDLIIQVAQRRRTVNLVAYADPDLLTARARQLNLPLILKGSYETALAPHELAVRSIKTAAPVIPGQLDVRNAHYVLECLQTALDDTLAGNTHAVVTGPVNKAVINDAGIPFSGHTEFFAQQTNTRQVVMLLATEGLKVALATTHLPLSEVPKAITWDSLVSVITRINTEFQTKFGLAQPRISVCGLNPHAGEGGHLGMEEIDTIIPALNHCRELGIHVEGPFPADTLFTPRLIAQCDVVLAMYHDQGLPVLKYKGFGAAVNITLGLPLIRTSVDHGTALDLAGTGQASTGSLETAIHYAHAMAEHQI